MPDYIPAPDGDFHIWQNNFLTYVNGHLADLGLVAADLTAAIAALGVWTTKYPAHVAAAAAPPPADPAALTFLAVDTRTPYVAQYDGADGGKTAHYLLRWVSTTGEKGPWSETASATIEA